MLRFELSCMLRFEVSHGGAVGGHGYRPLFGVDVERWDEPVDSAIARDLPAIVVQ